MTEKELDDHCDKTKCKECKFWNGEITELGLPKCDQLSLVDEMPESEEVSVSDFEVSSYQCYVKCPNCGEQVVCYDVEPELSRIEYCDFCQLSFKLITGSY